MRKYIVFSVITLGLIGLLIYLYLPDKPVDEILVISESHYILYEPDMTIGIKFFSSRKQLIKKTDIDGGFIQNGDQSLKFLLVDLNIEKIHDERFLDTLYFGYELQFKLPEITDSYYMEELFLRLKIKGEYYELFGGSLYVEYPEMNDKYLDWFGIEGIKKDVPKLFQILVDVYDVIPIEKIVVGPENADFFIGSDNIVIQIPENKYVFTTTFVKIYTDFGVTYLPNFEYFINYELLSSGFYKGYVIM